MSSHQDYWVGQKAFIRKSDEVLVLTDPIEGLDYPGGRVDEGEEDLGSALKREVTEETGLQVNVGKPFAVWQRTFPPEHREAGKKVFLVAFECDYISGEVRLSDEHNNFRWVNKNNYHEVNDGTQYFEILEKYFNQQD